MEEGPPYAILKVHQNSELRSCFLDSKNFAFLTSNPLFRVRVNDFLSYMGSKGYSKIFKGQRLLRYFETTFFMLNHEESLDLTLVT